MTVLILTACSATLRGHLTRWLFEVAPGVFVGRPSARIRDHIWIKVTSHIGIKGKAVLVYSNRGEQGLAFRTCNSDWEPVDYDGLMLIKRPTK